MKKKYVKPEAENLDFKLNAPIMNDIFDGSFGVGEDEDDGI